MLLCKWILQIPLLSRYLKLQIRQVNLIKVLKIIRKKIKNIKINKTKISRKKQKSRIFNKIKLNIEAVICMSKMADSECHRWWDSLSQTRSILCKVMLLLLLRPPVGEVKIILNNSQAAVSIWTKNLVFYRLHIMKNILRIWQHSSWFSLLNS